MRVSYDKLKAYVESATGYSMRELGDEIELVFNTPSIEEAAGIGEGGEGSQMVLKGVRRGPYVEFKEAYVRRGERTEPIDLRDLELWLQYIENL
ncbi:MAG: hypothetical protein QXP98_02145 [Thermoproteus sp.]